MSTQENTQIVKDAFAALGRGDKQGLRALSAEDVEWIIPGEAWPLAGTHRGYAGLADLVQKASEIVETSFPERPNSYLRKTGFWLSASVRGESKPRRKRSRTILYLLLLFEMANWRRSGSISTRKHWRGPRVPDPLRPIPHETINKLRIR